MEFNINIILGIIIGILITVIIYIIFNNLSKPKCGDLNTILKILIRQASRWSTAASQDENTLVAILHANYGAGYLWAIKDIATDSQIKEATGIDVQKFTFEIVNTQDKITKKMLEICPKYSPKKTYLTKLGGE